MPCERYELPGGAFAIVCRTRGRTRRCQEPACGRPSGYQCDWKLTGGKKGATCDRHLCTSHAPSPAPGKNLCPAHWTAYEAWLSSRGKAVVGQGTP